jgi:hypothetical protein
MDDSYLEQCTIDLTLQSAIQEEASVDKKLSTDEVQKITDNIWSPRSAMLINDMSDDFGRRLKTYDSYYNSGSSN